MDVTRKDRISAKSEAVHRAAAALIPTEKTDSRRAWPPITGNTPVIAKGKGGTVTDVDGNEYLNYAGAQHAMILGHADERVVVAINKTASKGCGPALVSETAVRLGELVTSRFASIDMVRFLDSPADSLFDVVRLARAFTGRERIVMLEGYVHRCLADQILRHLGTDAGTSAGSYNDAAAVEATFRKHGSEIAALLVEPLATGFGLAVPIEGFLPKLRALCHQHDALLVYDETIVGCRLPVSAVPGLSEASPDLTVLGNILGGGLGLAAYGGRKTVMKHVGSEAVSVCVEAGSGNQVAMAAAVATLQALGESDFYDRLEALAARLDEGLREAASAADCPANHRRAGSLLGIYFTDTPGNDLPSANTQDTARYERFFHAMLDRGVLLPTSSLAPICVLAAHTNEQIDQTIEAARESLSLVGTGD